MGFLARNARSALIAAAGGLAATAAAAAISRSPAAKSLERTNHQGHTVSLKEGPAAAVGASVAAAAGAGKPAPAAAALTAGLGSGAFGLYDDVVGADPAHQGKGLKGHLSALLEGRVTSGAVKVAGLGLTGLAAAAMVDSARGRTTGRFKAAANTLLGAGVIAGSANLMNLFDLRPGRALKVTAAVSGSLSGGDTVSGRIAAGTTGAATALLPDDLSEQTMLGDCGANALGALTGLSLVERSGPVSRAVLLGAVTSLTLASEKVSFTKVIAETPMLRELDEFGRKSLSDR